MGKKRKNIIADDPHERLHKLAAVAGVKLKKDGDYGEGVKLVTKQVKWLRGEIKAADRRYNALLERVTTISKQLVEPIREKGNKRKPAYTIINDR